MKKSQDSLKFFYKKAPNVQILFFFFFSVFWNKLFQKPIWIFTWILYYLSLSSLSFFYFSYSNKSENLCNNFDFEKKYGSKNSGLFCNLLAIWSNLTLNLSYDCETFVQTKIFLNVLAYPLHHYDTTFCK